MSTHLKKLLASRLSADELDQLVGSFDVVGDIAVVIIPTPLLHRSGLIAEAILSTSHHLRTVLRRAGVYSGEFRTLPLECIGGEARRETEVREFGLRYRLNLETCYFSVRSGVERQRIAGMVKTEERVLVLFSGIAPFPLMIARDGGAQVIGVEKNPAAHRYAVENVRRNRLESLITLYCMDAADFLSHAETTFHRIVMPLPRGGDLFLPAALRALRPGGTLHFYRMAKMEECSAVSAILRQQATAAGHCVSRITCTKAGHCGNRSFRWCFDTEM
ncbi:hypothetical protein JWG39_06615 [Desulforhopalus vacuolatus]|uniref:class I SAM-dependent methyltransferase n=1 Tax=Desulforhopalus vacuolatus TaxID=40414 RepID=UPI001965C999|nr:hypothetical protein [Desulforhopalus vacuolatus]MBM9519492.1 hypothetical protein [Desulforhopalus vacuolatus]